MGFYEIQCSSRAEVNRDNQNKRCGEPLKIQWKQARVNTFNAYMSAEGFQLERKGEPWSVSKQKVAITDAV